MPQRGASWSFGAGVVVCLLATAPAMAQSPVAKTNGEVFTDRGLLVWQGPEELTLDRIAHLIAPVLWFSPDEPLLLNGRPGIPHPHPCGPASADAVVYYQARRIRLTALNRVTVPEHEDPAFFDKVDSFTIRFYFYYDRDFGMSSHRHDLELVEMEVALARDEAGQREVRLRKVVGFAHGIDWYSNELRVEADTRLPVTVLVEEGKHASSPDRNADGIYTPGYDVNRRINDAWGVRDVLGSGFLVASAFQASMAKPRRPADRRAPPAVDAPHPVGVLASHDRHDPALARYVLRPAWEVPVCAPPGPDLERLREMTRAYRFGSEHPADQYHIDLLHELAERLTGTNHLVPSVGLRWDRRLGVTVQLRGLEVQEIYLVPKINWVGKDVGFEMLFTRTAAQWASGYLSVGAAREYFSETPEWNVTQEMGMKFRTRFQGRLRAISLGHPFAGVRFGVRFSGRTTVRHTRMIVEMGSGVW